MGFQVLGDSEGADYLVRAGYPGVFYSVPRSRIDGFPRELFSFRFKELSNFETLDVQSLELIFKVRVKSNSTQMESVREPFSLSLLVSWQINECLPIPTNPTGRSD